MVPSNRTRLTKFPCPKCGVYYEPEATLKTKAIMKCTEHGLFEIDINRSLNFRKFCSKIASKPNRSPFYYTTSELRIKEALDKLNIKYFHNVGVEINGHKYWLDFYLPFYNVWISCDPSVWHKLWNRQSSDINKARSVVELGIKALPVKDEQLKLNSKELTAWLKKALELLRS